MTLLLALSFASCEESVSEQVEDQDQPLTEEGISFSVDKIRIVGNGLDKAAFTVLFNGVDVTAESTFYQSGTGVAMSDNTFSTSVIGEYEFYASYGSELTDKISIYAGPTVGEIPADPAEGSVAFYSRLLLVQFTGTGCTYCPYMIDAIDDVLEDSVLGAKVEHVAVHTYNSDDPLYGTSANNFKQCLGIVNYPTVLLNFDTDIYTWNNGSSAANYDKLYTLINSTYVESPTAAVCASTSISGSILSANVGVKAAVEGEYRVGMLLLESGISAYQTGSGTIIHNNGFRESAMRATSFDFSGSSVGELEVGECGSAILDIEIDSSWDLDNCHLLFYVTAPIEAGENNSGVMQYDYIIQNVVRCEIEGSVAYGYAL